MALSDVVARVVAFLRAGYPHGVPATDYVPLIALLRRRLSDDEVVVASELAAKPKGRPAAARRASTRRATGTATASNAASTASNTGAASPPATTNTP